MDQHPKGSGDQSSSSVVSSTSGNPIISPDPPFSPVFEDVRKYQKICKMGNGNFAEYKAKDKTDASKIVVVSKIKPEEPYPFHLVSNHRNVVDVFEICSHEESMGLYLVHEFYEHYNLAGLLANDHVAFSLGQIKNVMKQLYDGLCFLHALDILHVDLRSSNIFINEEGVLKLKGFYILSLAQALPVDTCSTPWYFAPELLLGGNNYLGLPANIWAAGCLMTEMWTRTPIMQGDTFQHQLLLITQLCGSITFDVWPDGFFIDSKRERKLPSRLKRKVKEKFRPLIQDENALDLIDKQLEFNPRSRLTAAEVFNHDFFSTDPMPCSLEDLLTAESETHSPGVLQNDVVSGSTLQ